MDVIFNGQASGSVAARLLACNMDVGSLRPYIDTDGTTCITSNGQVITVNNPAPFTKDAWKSLDDIVMASAKAPLALVADLRSQGLVKTITNGMGKTTFEFQDESDITDAAVSMEPTIISNNDRPVYNLKNIPLPVIHKDVIFGAREIAISRSGNATSLDLSSLALQSRKCAEMAEKLAVGIGTPYTVGSGSIYGITTFPQRQTYEIADPSDVGWTPEDTLNDVLEMRELSTNDNHYGPWRLYNSPAFDKYLDRDFSTTSPGITLRERILKLTGISAVKTLNYLTGFRLILVEMDVNTIREVIGLDFTPVQWEEKGGLQIHIKVMGIMVPNLRADFYEQSGVIDGAPA